MIEHIAYKQEYPIFGPLVAPGRKKPVCLGGNNAAPADPSLSRLGGASPYRRGSIGGAHGTGRHRPRSGPSAASVWGRQSQRR
jgi:hypothetical protein